MCVQMSSGRDGARLLIMKLQITKSNYSPISSQKILCPELPSPPLYLAFSLSSIPRFFFFFLHFSLSLSLSLFLPTMLCLLCRALQQTEWHHHPRWWTAAFENSMYTYCMCVCAWACLRSASRSRRSSATDDSKDHHLQKRSIVCVCVCVCVCVWAGKKQASWSMNGKIRGQKVDSHRL